MTLPPLYLLLILVGAANEELIARAYLMTEVVALCGSTIVAILASTCFQTLYHLYLGTPTALLSGCSFLFFSIYYAYRRRAMPLILSHFLYNFLAAGYHAYGA
ncbi:MAG: CPBP family intramembrane metalloprotease [Deltaproteobacteria bacterium]|nr:MAG: CPBP family intramembrane metalloprotease [Deltaproteobacteria bacterium]